MILSIFDLDNTLINGDSDHAWGEFLVAKGLVDAKHYQKTNDYFYQQYQHGGLNIHEYLAFALQPLADNDKSQLDIWHKEFMQEYIAPMLQAKAQELLQKHRDKGHFLLIITATNGFITEPIADILGVDDILSTDAECKDGQYTGKTLGTPCFQEGKVERLNAWLEGKPYDLQGSYFYSDSHNDLPLLNMVDNPVVVDADDILREHALQQHWPHISLREDNASISEFNNNNPLYTNTPN